MTQWATQHSDASAAPKLRRRTLRNLDARSARDRRERWATTCACNCSDTLTHGCVADQL